MPAKILPRNFNSATAPEPAAGDPLDASVICCRLRSRLPDDVAAGVGQRERQLPAVLEPQGEVLRRS
jgi:hypothetical protein